MTVKTAIKPCTCSLVAAVDTDGNVTTTGCKATTKRVFAPGHDARLKGFLIRSGISEQMISVGAESNRTAQQVAEQFGFGWMVAAGIKNGQAKLIAKLLGEVSKGTKVAVKAAPKPQAITGKVGRWTYTGTELDGLFTYITAKGETVITAKYTKI